jgi:hypothetical protein
LVSVSTKERTMAVQGDPPSNIDPPRQTQPKLFQLAISVLFGLLGLIHFAREFSETFDAKFTIVVSAGEAILALAELAPAKESEKKSAYIDIPGTSYDSRSGALLTDPNAMKTEKKSSNVETGSLGSLPMPAHAEKKPSAHAAKKAAKIAEVVKVTAPAIGISACWSAFWAFLFTKPAEEVPKPTTRN